VVVTTAEDDDDYRLNPRLDLVSGLAPDGVFAWGYGGAGPRRLGLALLADCLGDELALRHYIRFTEETIRQFPTDGPWSMRSEDIMQALEAMEST